MIAETARAPAWSPQGDRIAAVNDDGDIELIDPALGSGPTVATADLFTQEIAWSPDATTLALRYRRAAGSGSPSSRPRRALNRAARSHHHRHLETPLWSPDSAAVTVSR